MTLRRVIAAGAVLGTGLLLTGCGLKDIGAPAQQETRSYDVAERAAALRVEAGAGDVVVTESARSGIHVTETLHWKSSKPTTRHPVESDTLKLDSECGHADWGCDVDYKIEIPPGVGVTINTGAGDITLRALTGDLRTSTGAGDLDASGLAVKKVSAKSGAGEVELRFTSAPDDVDVQTGAGAGIVHVPQDTYAVTTEAGMGEEEIQVTDDDSAPRRIVVKTGAGDAKVLKV